MAIREWFAQPNGNPDGTVTLFDGDLEDLEERVAYGYTARVYRNTAQTIPGSELTKLSYTHERWDDNGFWVVGTPTRITIPADGVYTFGANIEWDVNSTGNRYADFFLNNDTIIGELAAGWAINASAGPFNVGTTSWLCSEGDYVEVRVYQSSGDNLDIVAGTASEANHNDFWVTLERLV